MLPHLRYRAHYICEDTMADFVYIMVAIVLGFLFLRALIYKGKFIIEVCFYIEIFNNLIKENLFKFRGNLFLLTF